MIFASLLLPFLLQGMAIVIDEFYFHHKRGLLTWERIGHPLDTLTVSIALIFLIVMPLTVSNLLIFTGLALFSCLFVTKDEWVHIKYCDAKENWLHALLFVLHPLVFVSSAIAWALNARPELGLDLSLTTSQIDLLWTTVQIQLGITVVFIIYQVSYWLIYQARATR